MVDSSSQYDTVQHVKYIRDMVFQYTEHMLWCELGFMTGNNFEPETLDDVYCSHLYCMSWFYGGTYLFDTWETEYDDYLRQEVDDAVNCSGTE